MCLPVWRHQHCLAFECLQLGHHPEHHLRVGRWEQVNKAPSVPICFEGIRGARYCVFREGQVGWEEVIVLGGKEVDLGGSCPRAYCVEAPWGQGPVRGGGSEAGLGIFYMLFLF